MNSFVSMQMQREWQRTARFMLAPSEALYRESCNRNCQSKFRLCASLWQRSPIRKTSSGRSRCSDAQPSSIGYNGVPLSHCSSRYALQGSSMVSIKVETDFQRAAAKGTGWVKSRRELCSLFSSHLRGKHQGFKRLLSSRLGHMSEEV